MQVACSLGYGGVVVRLSILFGQSHVALGINRVIIAPVGHRSNRHACFERVRMSHRIESHRSAVTPAPDRDALFVKLRVLCEQTIERGKLIFQFNYPEFLADGSTECSAAIWSAAVVHGEDGKTPLDEKLMEELGRATPGIVHQLPGRASVDTHDHGNFGAGSPFRRQEELTI